MNQFNTLNINLLDSSKYKIKNRNQLSLNVAYRKTFKSCKFFAFLIFIVNSSYVHADTYRKTNSQSILGHYGILNVISKQDDSLDTSNSELVNTSYIIRTSPNQAYSSQYKSYQYHGSKYLTKPSYNHTNFDTRKLNTPKNTSNDIKSSLSNNNDNTKKDLDFRNIKISKYKIATMHVLSGLCPKLLSEDQQLAFSKAFNNRLNAILPEINNPKDIFHNLYAQKDYRIIFTKMKNNQSNFSESENRALCQDIVSYQY